MDFKNKIQPDQQMECSRGKTFDKKFAMEYFVLKCSNLKNVSLDGIPKLCSVCRFISKHKVETKDQIQGQYLFGKSKIIDKKEPLYFGLWVKSTIQRIQDIYGT